MCEDSQNLIAPSQEERTRQMGQPEKRERRYLAISGKRATKLWTEKDVVGSELVFLEQHARPTPKHTIFRDFPSGVVRFHVPLSLLFPEELKRKIEGTT
eukprot:6327347-Amphidinium_carterae.1